MELVQEIHQLLMDREDTCHRTCFSLQLNGNSLDNFAELKSVEGLVDGSVIKVGNNRLFLHWILKVEIISAVFWRKVLLVLKVILRYGIFKVFLFFGPEKSSKEGLEVATPENLKWKKYIGQSENANGSTLGPLWCSKKLKVSTKRTLWPTNLPFWFGDKSSWCRFEKKRKVQKVLHFWSGEKSWWCSF